MRWIYMSHIYWESYTLFQRPQQMCKALASLNEEVFFIDYSRDDDQLFLIDGVNVVGRRYMINQDEEAVFLLSHTDYFKYKKDYNVKLFIFDHLDEFTEEYSDNDNNDFKECLEQANIITVVSQRLYKIISDRKPDKPILYLPNAADSEHFKDAKSLPVPTELQNFARPIVGFSGAIASWIDMKLLAGVIKRTPEMTWVFVGMDYTGRNNILRNSFENVYFIDWKLYANLPAYIGAFDVGIIPFQVRDLTHSSSPVKMYEYLSSGIPVLSTPIAEAIACPYVNIADTVDDWVNSLNSILYGSSKESVEDRQLYAQDETWVLRMKNLLEFMDK